MIQNHYGLTVDTDTPITGVINANTPEWLHEDIINGIDLDFEQHKRECKNEDHDDCWYDSGDNTILIGYIEEDESYTFDPNAEYSAIISEVYAQITNSKYTQRCTLCSPCFPGQGDLDTDGEFLTYTLPPEVWGIGKRYPIYKQLTIEQYSRMIDVYADFPITYKSKIDDELLRLDLVQFWNDGLEPKTIEPKHDEDYFYRENGRPKKEWFNSTMSYLSQKNNKGE